MSGATRLQSSIEVREIIKNRLNADKVKLWLEPYTTSDGQRGPAIAVSKLVIRISNFTNTRVVVGMFH